MSRFKFTYANVVATIALIIALGGASAFAATQLAKNSVGTKQIKKNAVNGAKVKDQSLTGKDINLAKLGTVPSATNAANATTAGTAGALTPPEGFHLIGASGEPPFLGGSENLQAPGINLQPAGFYKDHEGIVHLEGIVKIGPGSGTVPIFNLPPGYRPANGAIQIYPTGDTGATGDFLVAGTAFSTGTLHANAGDVVGNPGEFVILSGTTYRGG